MIRILVVDDDSALRAVMVEAIMDKHFGAKIVQASNGIEGKDKLIDLLKESLGGRLIVITDFQIDGMNGLELAKFIKSVSLDARVIVISAILNSDQLQARVEALGFLFLKKPFKVDDLCQIISGLLKR